MSRSTATRRRRRSGPGDAARRSAARLERIRRRCDPPRSQPGLCRSSSTRRHGRRRRRRRRRSRSVPQTYLAADAARRLRKPQRRARRPPRPPTRWRPPLPRRSSRRKRALAPGPWALHPLIVPALLVVEHPGPLRKLKLRFRVTYLNHSGCVGYRAGDRHGGRRCASGSWSSSSSHSVSPSTDPRRAAFPPPRCPHIHLQINVRSASPARTISTTGADRVFHAISGVHCFWLSRQSVSVARIPRDPSRTFPTSALDDA